MDLPGYFEHQSLPVSYPDVRLLATSFSLLEADCESLDAFRSFAVLADRLQVPYLRIFGAGGAGMGEDLTSEQLKIASTSVRQLQKILTDNGSKSQILLETHDVFSSSKRCIALNNMLDVPVKILWDSHHTWRLAGESPEMTWRALGPLIQHIHYKDSVSDPKDPHGHRYVKPGEGEFPTKTLHKLLQSVGYTGGISLEWEKLWHSYLPSIEEPLPHFLGAFPRHKVTE